MTCDCDHVFANNSSIMPFETDTPTDLRMAFEEYVAMGYCPIIVNKFNANPYPTNGDIKKIVERGRMWMDNAKLYDPNQSNIALLTGTQYGGLVVVDIDANHSEGDTGMQTYQEWSATHDFTDTPKQKTPSQGYHLFYRSDEPITKATEAFTDSNGQKTSIDIIGEGGRIVVYPSSRPESVRNNGSIKMGGSYTWETPVRAVGDLPEMPQWMQENHKNHVQRKSVATVAQMRLLSKTFDAVSIEKMAAELEVSYSELEGVVKMLPKELADSHSDWFKVVAAIVTTGEDNGYDTTELCHAFSKQCRSKYNKESVDKQISILKNRRVSNPAGFRTLVKMRNDGIARSPLMRSVIDGNTMADFAELFYVCSPNNWLYCLKQSFWYELVDGTWRERGKEASTLIAAFPKVLVPVLRHTKTMFEVERIELEKRLEADGVKEGDSGMFKYLTETILQLVKLVDKIKNSGYILGAMRFLPDLYKRECVADLLDSNPDILCFTDKIYELESGAVRNYQMGDYVSTTTGYPYPTDVSKEQKQTVKAFIRKMFSCDEDCEYLLSILAYSLSGTNYLEVFFILVGVGSNGKSVLAELVRQSLGKYFGVMPVSYLTQKRGSSSQACPELASKKGKRIVWASESEVDEKWNMSKIKEVSDNVETRTLYGKPFEFKPQFTLWGMTNNDPTFSCVDEGVKRRYRGIPFNKRFVIAPEGAELKAGEEHADIQLKKDIEKGVYRDAFMCLLLDYYKKNVAGNKVIPEPESVKTYTEEVVQDSDRVRSFCDEYLLVTNNEKDKVKLGEILNIYKKVTEDHSMQLAPFGKKLKGLGIKRSQRMMIGVQIKDFPDENQGF